MDIFEVRFAPHGASELKYSKLMRRRERARFAPHGASELKSKILHELGQMLGVRPARGE